MREHTIVVVNDTTTAMTLVTELHGFERFASAPQLMAYLGLTPSEYSSGGKRKLGSITKAGNAHVRRVLVESAWNYRHAYRVGAKLKKRHKDGSPKTIALADRAMRRLRKRWVAMSARNVPNQKIAVAIARELVGFIWAALTNRPTKARTKKTKTYKLKTKAAA